MSKFEGRSKLPSSLFQCHVAPEIPNSKAPFIFARSMPSSINTYKFRMLLRSKLFHPARYRNTPEQKPDSPETDTVMRVQAVVIRSPWW